jgi:hypothetical protein
VVLILPLPLAIQLDPADATQAQIAEVIETGNVSATAALVTGLGPLLVTVTVYVVVPPGTYVVVPSVFTIDRSAIGDDVSVSVLVQPPVAALKLLPAAVHAVPRLVVPAGGATIPVLSRLPVAAALMFAVTVYVAVPFTSRLTVLLMLPLPLAAAQLEPADATQVHGADVIAAGNVSVTGALVTGLGPLLVTVIVYVVVPPGTYVVVPSVFTIDRSATGDGVSVSVLVQLPSAAL